ncbi:hypothetical protein AGMMS50255_0530 [Spirochaetia bacterium]|nr:hypothetical protein AGMMS50255_0530 [Spirochaetia bacterium]
MADHHFDQDKYDAKEYFNNVIFKSNIGGGIVFDITKYITLIANTRLGYDITPIGKKSGFLIIYVHSTLPLLFKPQLGQPAAAGGAGLPVLPAA